MRSSTEVRKSGVPRMPVAREISMAEELPVIAATM
jgi:hypothetical protein